MNDTRSVRDIIKILRSDADDLENILKAIQDFSDSKLPVRTEILLPIYYDPKYKNKIDHYAMAYGVSIKSSVLTLVSGSN